jgi:hypothetical protein
MNGGACKHLATFERRTTIVGDFESGDDVWDQQFEEMVCLEPASGSETPEHLQMQERVPYKASMRWSTSASELSSGDRMLVGERTFEITSVVNVNERNHWIEAMAVESRA